MNGQGMFILNTMEKLGELSYTSSAINVREDGKLVNSDGIPYLDKNAEEISLPFKVLAQRNRTKSVGGKGYC